MAINQRIHNDFDDERADIRRRLERILRRQASMARTLDRMGTVAADIEEEIRVLDQVLQTAPSRPRRRELLDALIPLGPPVAHFSISWDARERARVRINDKEFELSPRLAELLALLASGDFGDSDDELVGWKPLAEVAGRQSQKSASRHVTVHAVSQNLCRLRDCFAHEGIPTAYLQSEKRRGARLALPRHLVAFAGHRTANS